MVGRVIKTDACVTEGAAWLAEREPRFAYALEQTGALPLRLRKDGFAALLSAVVSQQISVAAAGRIWTKLENLNACTRAGIQRLNDNDLRACGLSRPKIRYARALADAKVNYPAMRHMSEEQVIEQLTTIKGIGRWTAEIYVMFALGRADAFAAGDLALQEAARALFDLRERPSENALRTMAEAWSPWRAVAARLLFSYYRVVRSRDGVR